MEIAFARSTEIKEKIEERPAAVLPVGAVEAHGAHLPLGTDNILAERLTKRLAEETQSFQLPLLPYGQVWSLKQFPGSISITNDVLINTIVSIGESLYQQGFCIFAIVNGHLGNQTALKEAARVLYDRFPDLRVFYFFYPGLNQKRKEVEESAVHHSYFHACEIETSMMRYVAPEYVDMSRAIDDPPQIPIEADFTPTPWEVFTETAVLGEATKATAEKGEIIIEHALQQMKLMMDRAYEECRKIGREKKND
ncbi:creatininase family protein [uncultured Marinococcus sp.]|uniref:creatininase family protein n=1 Tax=uncultured Marinococcus sp. TaxID=487012 RepID=UPI002615B622|nr:creatininase family protein [uncultured Marinococcus sp.]